MTKRNTSGQSRAAAAVSRHLMLAPVVAAMRMPIMAAEATGSALAGRSESLSAVSEKFAALGDGMVAAQFAWMRGIFLLPMAMARSVTPAVALFDMADAVATAALKPAALQVRRNHRRLTRLP